jgi:hypothetical protein
MQGFKYPLYKLRGDGDVEEDEDGHMGSLGAKNEASAK